MGDALSYLQIKDFLLNFTRRVLQSRDELNRMDAACGDGDLGTTLYVAFNKVLTVLESSRSGDIGTLLSEVGDAILSSAGGAAGPIFGTLFAEAGRTTKSRTELSVSELAAMFEASLRKVEALGGAHVGDKTLIDVLDPAVASLKISDAKKRNLPLALENAANTAETGYELTKSVAAKQGRAKYLGEQTLGKPDPGAYVTMLIFDSLYNEAKRGD